MGISVKIHHRRRRTLLPPIRQTHLVTHRQPQRNLTNPNFTITRSSICRRQFRWCSKQPRLDQVRLLHPRRPHFLARMLDNW